MSSERTRRDFLKTGLFGLSSMAAFSALSACSTLDEYIFDDQFDLKDQVLIVGGGISGLYLAYKLRQTRTEFRLLEGSNYFGGRVRSAQGLDFGASLFDRSDVHMQQLIKEFNLTTISVSKDHFAISGGAEMVSQALQNRIAGLMPYRSLRLRWKLVSIRVKDNKYETVFETPNGRRTMHCRKIALTLPPGQWSAVNGLLDLPEMLWARDWLTTLTPENITKVNVVAPNTGGVMSLANKKTRSAILDKDSLAVVAKPLKNNQVGLEFEYITKQVLNPSTFKIESPNNLEIEKIVDLINAKTKLGLSFKKLNSDSFFDWSSVGLIQSAYFKNDRPLPGNVNKNPHFQVFGDYSASKKAHTVEGALLEADRVSSLFV
ncbi:MAG: FAD-dependent oxidoreductase [Bdellovibrio sp.]|nr:FAD-dependent oxidoreductase [Bdellovibrio sp.]